MKYIAIYTLKDSRKPIGQVYYAKNQDQVVEALLKMGVEKFSVVEEQAVNVTPIVLSTYNSEVIAISKLANVKIAAEDYNIGGKEVDGKHYFTYDEALKVQEELKNTGWRLPTRSEWVLICEEFGQKDGQLDTETLYKNLNMDYTGYRYSDGKVYGRTTYGYWWSATHSSATNANYLFTGTSLVDPQDSLCRGYGLALRLVRDVKGNK